jgi:beta-N-acetylhexosaminidase
LGQGAYIFAPAGPDLSGAEAAFFRRADPWGFILFQRNCETPEQLRRLTSDLREAVGRDAPILIDQEGGRVQRMRAPHWREWLPPLDQVEMTASPRAMYLRGRLIGAELLAHGIDVNCAPSADIAWPETHPFLRNRCYGTDAARVTEMARACAEGLFDAGCLPVIKHAPGHGRATLDSHKALPRIDVPLAELAGTDFAPFRALSDLPMAMTAHIVLPEIDPETPLTLSPEGIDYLRREVGLTGLLMTDDISMGALEGDVATRAARAMAAGCDLVLHCNGVLDEMETIASVVTDRTGERADVAVSSRRTPTDIDIQALEAEFAALIEGADNA